jgi:hypothetical protein
MNYVTPSRFKKESPPPMPQAKQFAVPPVLVGEIKKTEYSPKEASAKDMLKEIAHIALNNGENENYSIEIKTVVDQYTKGDVLELTIKCKEILCAQDPDNHGQPMVRFNFIQELMNCLGYENFNDVILDYYQAKNFSHIYKVFIRPNALNKLGQELSGYDR